MAIAGEPGPVNGAAEPAAADAAGTTASPRGGQGSAQPEGRPYRRGARYTAPWRVLRGWSDAELRAALDAQEQRGFNFDVPEAHMTERHGWTVDGVEDRIGGEPPGPPLPDGLFANAKQAIANYDFSDPRIVVGHFDPRAPLPGRDMLLEMKVLGLRFLGGVRVNSVRNRDTDGRSEFGFRYDTLEGHFEQGYEWFLLSKDHASGEVRFKIEAHWRAGDFPTWWSRLGFRLVGDWIREFWRRRAVTRLRRLAHQGAATPDPPDAPDASLVHRGQAPASRTPPASPRE